MLVAQDAAAAWGYIEQPHIRFDLLLKQADDTQQVEPVLAREGARTARPRDRPGSVRVRLACTRPALRSGKFDLCQQGFDHASDGCLSEGRDGMLRLANRRARIVSIVFAVNASRALGALAGQRPDDCKLR